MSLAIRTGTDGSYLSNAAILPPTLTSRSVTPVASEGAPIIFVVDDDVSVRESLELLVQNEGWRPKMFASAEEFLECPRVVAPGCLILDVSLPGLDGLGLQKRVAAERTELPIIFIAGHGDVRKIVQAMKEGAIEFLTKPFNEELLLAAIRQALERSRLALTHQAEMRELRDRYASLTPRERQVMVLVVSGLLNKQVGGELGISEITVKAHRGQVTQKMKANSLPELVKMAQRLSLTERAGKQPAAVQTRSSVSGRTFRNTSTDFRWSEIGSN